MRNARHTKGVRPEAADEDIDTWIAEVLAGLPPMAGFRAAARRTGYSARTLARWADLGLLRTVKVAGGDRRIVTASLAQLLRERVS